MTRGRRVCGYLLIGLSCLASPVFAEVADPDIQGGIRNESAHKSSLVDPESQKSIGGEPERRESSAEDGNFTGSPGCTVRKEEGPPPQGRNCWDPLQRLPTQPAAIPLEEMPPHVDCEIDLWGNRIGIRRPDAVKLHYGPFEDRATVKLILDPRTTECRRARFEILYGDEATEWTVNIGDSPSNNGYSGDGGHFSRDSEAQIVGGNLAVFGDDFMPADPKTGKVLAEAKELAGPGRLVTLEVSDNRLSWSNDLGMQGQVESPFLFSLNGQEDKEGSPNYEIFAGFNSVVAGGRVGKGVKRVRIKLLP